MKYFPFILSTCIWLSVIVVFIRILSNSGLPFKKNKVFDFVLADKRIQGNFKVTSKDAAIVFGIACLFRVVVFIISIFAMYMFNDAEYSFEEMINGYLKWDANNYYRIAKGGYTYHTENGDFTTLAFFPLYPWLIRIINVLFRNEVLSGVVLSGLLYAGACTFLYKLLAMDYNKSTAQRTLIYMSVFPHALFFGVMMNESMLLFTMSVTLYYIRKHNWVLVGIFGALAALSRMVGILLAIPAAVEWLGHYKILDKLKQKKFADIWHLFYAKGLWIFLMLLGTGIYLFCNYKVTGDWFKFLEYQDKYWSNGSCYFGKGITLMLERAITEIKYTKFAIWIPEILSVTFVIAALVYGLRRHRSMYTTFLTIYIIINTGFEWPISIARYMTCAIPAFIILSDFTERHKWTEALITMCMAVAMGVYLTAYFMSRQIL